jgi:hypothetical protein
VASSSRCLNQNSQLSHGARRSPSQPRLRRNKRQRPRRPAAQPERLVAETACGSAGEGNGSQSSRRWPGRLAPKAADVCAGADSSSRSGRRWPGRQASAGTVGFGWDGGFRRVCGGPECRPRVAGECSGPEPTPWWPGSACSPRGSPEPRSPFCNPLAGRECPDSALGRCESIWLTRW